MSIYRVKLQTSLSYSSYSLKIKWLGLYGRIKIMQDMLIVQYLGSTHQFQIGGFCSKLRSLDFFRHSESLTQHFFEELTDVKIMYFHFY